MLTQQDISEAKKLARYSLANISFHRYIASVYGLWIKDERLDDKLLLLMYALGTYDARQGAENTLTEEQVQNVIQCIEIISRTVEAQLRSLDVNECEDCEPNPCDTVEEDEIIIPDGCEGLIINEACLIANEFFIIVNE